MEKKDKTLTLKQNIPCSQNDHTEKSLPIGNSCPTDSTADRIAKEYGISPRTVQRAYEYSQAIDTIAENHSEEVKQKILAGAIKTTQKEVKELASKSIEEQKKIAFLIF